MTLRSTWCQGNQAGGTGTFERAPPRSLPGGRIRHGGEVVVTRRTLAVSGHEDLRAVRADGQGGGVVRGSAGPIELALGGVRSGGRVVRLGGVVVATRRPVRGAGHPHRRAVRARRDRLRDVLSSAPEPGGPHQIAG